MNILNKTNFTEEEYEFLDSIPEEFSLQSEWSEEKADELKKSFSDIVLQYEKLEVEKTNIEIKLKNINKELQKIESKIRGEWGPYIRGLKKAELGVGDFVIESKEIQNIKSVNKDAAIEWLMLNGYKDAMKFDLHTATMKKIADEQLNEKNIQIPGLEYSKFNKIKIRRK